MIEPTLLLVVSKEFHGDYMLTKHPSLCHREGLS